MESESYNPLELIADVSLACVSLLSVLLTENAIFVALMIRIYRGKYREHGPTTL